MGVGRWERQGLHESGNMEEATSVWLTREEYLNAEQRAETYKLKVKPTGTGDTQVAEQLGCR